MVQTDRPNPPLDWILFLVVLVVVGQVMKGENAISKECGDVEFLWEIDAKDDEGNEDAGNVGEQGDSSITVHNTH